VRRIREALSTAVFLAVVGLFLVALLTNGLIILQATLSPVHVVRGDSMAPSIRSEDGVVLRPVEPDQVSVGEIVAFPDPLEPGMYLLHRVIEIREVEREEYAVTKGDNNPVPDPFMVPVEDVEGEVLWRLPKAGLYLDYLRSPRGFVTVVLLPTLLLVLYLLAKHLEQWLDARGKKLLLFNMDLLPVK
jgi:signal peptidase